MQKEDVAILIPSLNPRKNIIEIVRKLKESKFNTIFLIDDGSKEDSKKNFRIVEEEFDVNIIVHKINKGKGASLKDGIKYIQENTNLKGIVTMDSDGQHLIKDVEKVVDKMNENSVVLGVRDFDKDGIPFRNKFGNKFSSWYLKVVAGKSISDTQTGLRGIPRKYFDMSVKTEGNRYEYEMNVLMEWCKDKNCKIEAVPIETVYEKNNVSYFNPILDSIRIYKDFFKNIISSIICAVLDIVLFWLILDVFGLMNVFWSNTVARIISGFFDFTINKFWVFKNGRNQEGKKEFIKYGILFIVQMFINSAIVDLLSKVFFNFIILIKIIVNTVIYFANYFIKKRFIFN